MPVGQGPSGPGWLAIAFGFWSGRALATGTAWAGLCLIHHHRPLPLGFGLDGRLLLARRGRVYVQFTITIITISTISTIITTGPWSWRSCMEERAPNLRWRWKRAPWRHRERAWQLTLAPPPLCLSPQVPSLSSVSAALFLFVLAPSRVKVSQDSPPSTPASLSRSAPLPTPGFLARAHSGMPPPFDDVSSLLGVWASEQRCLTRRARVRRRHLPPPPRPL